MPTFTDTTPDLISKGELTVAWLPSGALVYSYNTLAAVLFVHDADDQDLFVNADALLSQTTRRHTKQVAATTGAEYLIVSRGEFMRKLRGLLDATVKLIDDESFADQMDGAGD